MRPIYTIFICFISAFLLGQNIKPHYIDGRVWIKFKPNFHYNHLTDAKGRIDAKHFPLPPTIVAKYQISECNQSFHFTDNKGLRNVYELVFNNIHLVDSLIRDISKLQAVEFVEPKPYVTKSIIPNDSFYIHNTGLGSSGGPFNWSWPLDNINFSCACLLMKKRNRA